SEAVKEVVRFLGSASGSIRILHVASATPRQRIDVLLQVFAEIRREFPRAMLLRVGGPLTAGQQALARQLSIEGAILALPFLTGKQLTSIYRQSTLLLLPSEREGFGLPLLEAMACGLPAVASNIPALQEVGGNAVLYSAVGDIQAFSHGATTLIHAAETRSSDLQKRRNACLSQAKKFSWERCANETAAIYEKVLTELP